MSGGISASAVAIAGTVASTLFSANAARQEGKQRQAALEYEAQIAEQNAGQQQAAAQRTAEEERRRARYAQSRALALAAAGGDASSPGVVDIISDLEAEGAYRGAVELYQGDERARGLRQQAATTRYGGKLARTAGDTAAVASILGGAGRTALLWNYGPPGGSPLIEDMVPGQYSLANRQYG